MDTAQHMETQIWGYIDDVLPAEEHSVVEKLIHSDAEWKLKYKQLLEVHEVLISSELESPSMRFTKNVMEEIGRLSIAPAAKKYINTKIIWGIGIFFIVIVVGFLIYGFGQVDWNSGHETDLSKKIAQVDFSRFFSNTWVNVFMMINIILGLFLLDNFFSAKRKHYRKEA